MLAAIGVNCNDDISGFPPNMNGDFALPNMDDGYPGLPDASNFLPKGCTQQDLTNMESCVEDQNPPECSALWLKQVKCIMNAIPDSCSLSEAKPAMQSKMAKCGQQGGGAAQPPTANNPNAATGSSAAASTSAFVLMTASSLVAAVIMI